MRIPDSLASLAEYGIIEEVLRPLMSGKEAQIYLVISGGQQRVAKVYKEAQNRTFKNRAEYTEGRKVRNTRDQRAMGKGTRHGRAQVEAAWRATEVEMIYRLRDAGVRVPVPYHFIDSVLVMEMITDAEGNPAPRLGDLTLEPTEAKLIFDRLLSEVVRMLSAGVVHGDLSDFNVLVGTDGPVIIDFPQSVDASSNANARKLLVRDVDNLHRFLSRFVPDYRPLPYAQEMWQLYERSQLAPDAKLLGRHRPSEQKANTQAVLDLIGDAEYDERKRRQGLGIKGRGGPNAPRADHGRADHGRPEQPRPEQPNVTPRRVEVVMAPAGRRTAPDSARQHAQPRDRDGAPHAQSRHGARPRDGAQPRTREAAQPQTPRTHEPRTREAAQPRTREAAQPQTQRTHEPRTRDAAQAPRMEDSRTREGSQPRHHAAAPGEARLPHPLRSAHGPQLGDINAADGPPKRRRRRRRRKPAGDVPKTSG